MFPDRRQKDAKKSRVEFRHPIAFWVGVGATALGVVLHLPEYLAMGDTGYEMAGMGPSPAMVAGMLLILCGMLLAAWGLLPRLDKATLHETDGVFKALDDAPLAPAHWGLFAVLTTALVVDVMKPATVGFVVPGMREEYGLSTGQVAAVPVSALTGTMIGSILWGYMGDRIGRRATILLSSLIFVSTTICGTMPAYRWNLLMCFLMGVSAGGLLPIVYALITESVPSSKRGRLAVLQGGLGTSLGYLAASGLAALLVPTFGWRILWFANLPTGLLILLLNRWIPESPRFLLQRGCVAEARAIMSRYGTVLQEAPEKADGVGAAADPTRGPLRASAPTERTRLFGAAFRTQTATIAAYGLSWGLVYWGFVTFLPTMLKNAGAWAGNPDVLLFGSSLLAIPGTLLVAYLYGSWSSRKAMVLYGGATVCALVAFAVVDPASSRSWLLAVLLVVLLTGSSGIIAMLSPYAAEVYPTDVRATGSGFAAACSKAGGIFGPPLIAVVLAALPGFAAVALVVATPMLVATLLVAVAGIETRGRKLEDVLTSAEDSTGTPELR